VGCDPAAGLGHRSDIDLCHCRLHPGGLALGISALSPTIIRTRRGRRSMRGALPVILLLAASPLAAQHFVPPDASAPAGGVRFGLFGFGTRLGFDVAGDKQVVGGFTIDAGHLFSDRVRVRPSAEIGFGNGANTYLVNFELMYRFTSDREIAVPYTGFGLGVWGQVDCELAPGCPGVWPQFALGFELRLREHINWLLEYHAEDTFSRHRLFIGLTTRRPS